MTTMDTPLSDASAKAADSQPATYGPMGLAAVPCSPSMSDKMSAMVSWLIEYHEGWYGPRARWNKKQRDDFDAKAGFLMLFIDGFEFTKENR